MEFGFEPVCDRLRTSFEPADVLEFGFYSALTKTFVSNSLARSFATSELLTLTGSLAENFRNSAVFYTAVVPENRILTVETARNFSVNPT